MDIGWSELLVIGVVALIVIGPKDLPEMFRTLGRFTAKMRSMAREFSRAMEDAARESGVDEVAGDLKRMTSARSLGLDAVKTAADRFEKWDPLKGARAHGGVSGAQKSGSDVTTSTIGAGKASPATIPGGGHAGTGTGGSSTGGTSRHVPAVLDPDAHRPPALRVHQIRRRKFRQAGAVAGRRAHAIVKKRAGSGEPHEHE